MKTNLSKISTSGLKRWIPASLLFLLFITGCTGGNIFTAIEKGSLDRVRLFLKENPGLLTHTDGTGRLPLHAAAVRGYKKIVEFLISQGAEVEQKDRSPFANTPLWYACLAGHRDTAAFLIARGAQVNAQNRLGETPIFCAAQMGHKQVVELLIKQSARVNIKEKKGDMPLHRVVAGGLKEIAELLLKEKADVNVVGSLGDTPLEVAVYWKKTEIVRLLISKGADFTEKSGSETLLHRAAYQDLKEVVEILISKGLDMNAVNTRGDTPLHLALRRGSLQAAMLLLENGARVDMENTKGETPADIGIRRGCPQVVGFLLPLHRAVKQGDVKKVERLAATFPQLIDVGDRLGWTPLFQAVIRDRLDIAKILLEKGAVVHKKSRSRRVDMLRGVVGKLLVPVTSRKKFYKDERTPMEVAAHHKNPEMVELLKKFGSREK
ncbi:MAG: ankyrin repeat domain-containing protein [Candidatus Aminicenantes bacterium]|nr:ankyrin repeat domain-containing protein [Candidatus Aminicenantes bacterium]